jgi:hypothetical protein
MLFQCDRPHNEWAAPSSDVVIRTPFIVLRDHPPAGENGAGQWEKTADGGVPHRPKQPSRNAFRSTQAIGSEKVVSA